MQIIETIDFRDIQIVWEFNSKKCLVSRNMLLIYRIVVPFDTSLSLLETSYNFSSENARGRNGSPISSFPYIPAYTATISNTFA